VPTAESNYGIEEMDRAANQGLLRWTAVGGIPVALAGIPVADSHGTSTPVAVIAGVVLAAAFLALLVAAPASGGWLPLGGLVLLSYWPCFAWAPFWFYPAALTLLYAVIGGIALLDRRSLGRTTSGRPGS
jgi:hypothetical protein